MHLIQIAICHSLLVTPHLVDKFVDDEGNIVFEYDDSYKRQVVSTATTETVTEILEAGVSGDGGAKNAYVKGYKVAAKTGTSEKFDGTSNATKEDEEFKARISSTVAYAPADDPQIAVISQKTLCQLNIHQTKKPICFL